MFGNFLLFTFVLWVDVPHCVVNFSKQRVFLKIHNDISLVFLLHISHARFICHPLSSPWINKQNICAWQHLAVFPVTKLCSTADERQKMGAWCDAVPGLSLSGSCPPRGSRVHLVLNKLKGFRTCSYEKSSWSLVWDVRTPNIVACVCDLTTSLHEHTWNFQRGNKGVD